MAVDTDELPDGLVGDMHSALMGACGWDDSDSYSRDVVGDMIDALAPLIVRELRAAAAEIDRLRSQNNRMRHLLTGDVSWLTGSVSFSPASDAARDKADRVLDAIRDLFSEDGAS